jgi:acyl-CoA thioester hydrolase
MPDDEQALPDPARVVIRRRIEWMDTDAAGIYHWTTAFRLAEAAEAAMHDALGVVGETFGATPRVAVSATFERPLHFNDRVEVAFVVQALGRTSVAYAFTITAAEGPAVRGVITSCLIDRDTRRAIPWPEHLRARLAGGGLVTAR